MEWAGWRARTARGPGSNTRVALISSLAKGSLRPPTTAISRIASSCRHRPGTAGEKASLWRVIHEFID